MELSNMKCQKATPKPKPYRIADGGGLALLITPEGGKLWRWRYRFEGKMKQMAFGKYPDVSLADARSYHADARKMRASGIDPMALKKQTKEKQKVDLAEAVVKESKTLTFKTLEETWFDWWKTDKDSGYIKDAETRMGRYVIPKVGTKAPGEITRMEWVTLIQSIDEGGARDIARRILQHVKQVYEHGKDIGLLDQNAVNPVADIRPDRILSNVTEEHFPSLPIGEMPEFLRKMRDYDGAAVTRIAMEFLGLTFVRTSEMRMGLWQEIDWKEKLWRLPKERMKGQADEKKPHIVPLSKQAIALLVRLHRITGDSGKLFPNEKDDNGYMSDNTILGMLKRTGYKGRMSGHGWRSVASTYLHEKGFDHEHIELQLAHTKQDKVSGAYNYAKYLEPRAVMMQAWADALDQMREEAS